MKTVAAKPSILKWRKIWRPTGHSDQSNSHHTPCIGHARSSASGQTCCWPDECAWGPLLRSIVDAQQSILSLLPICIEALTEACSFDGAVLIASSMWLLIVSTLLLIVIAAPASLISSRCDCCIADFRVSLALMTPLVASSILVLCHGGQCHYEVWGLRAEGPSVTI